MNLSFSVANPEQAKGISEFVNAAYRGDSSRVGWTTEADLLGGQRIDSEMLMDTLRSPDEVILIARNEDDLLVGCVHLDFFDPKACYLGMLTVKPELQNHGVGRKILNEAEAFARSKHCPMMTMSVLAQRRELIDWYCRRGYQMTREKKPFPYGDSRFGLPQRTDLEFLVLNKEL